MDEQHDRFRPPIMAFATLSNFIDDLASRPLPPQIDRSMMSNKSGTDQNNLLSTLSAFGLIGEYQRLLPKLETLATTDPEQRQAELGKLVREYYPDAVELSEAHGTHQQLNDVFKEKFGLDSSGDTRRKAITFFLHAARAADLPISANFPNTRSGSGGPGTPRVKRARSPRKTPPPAGGGGAGASAAGGSRASANGELSYSTEITIGDDTTLILTAKNPNPFGLSKEDRDFIFGLIDKMKEYGQRGSTTSPADAGAATDVEGEGGSS